MQQGVGCGKHTIVYDVVLGIGIFSLLSSFSPSVQGYCVTNLAVHVFAVPYQVFFLSAVLYLRSFGAV